MGLEALSGASRDVCEQRLEAAQVTNFRDHDAPDRLRDTKACQKESFYVIICII